MSILAQMFVFVVNICLDFGSSFLTSGKLGAIGQSDGSWGGSVTLPYGKIFQVHIISGDMPAGATGWTGWI